MLNNIKWPRSKKIFRLYHAYHAIRAWFYCRFVHRAHVLDLRIPPGYMDQDFRLLHANFAILSEFVENELDGVNGILETIKTFEKDVLEQEYEDMKACITEQIATYRTILDLYMYWHFERPPQVEKATLGDMSSEIYDKDDAMLVKLISVRRALWT